MSPEQPSQVDQRHYLERCDPTGHADHLATEHLARYEWACHFLPAKRVLDCSCGLGYGSAMLAERGAEHVVGVDIAPEAIEYARQHYGRPGIEFVTADALTLSPADWGKFDLIVSLEMIEHVPHPTRLLDVFRALLADDGVLALSCPNDPVLAECNPYHFWREDRAQLQGWLQARFGAVAVYSEVHSLGTGICPAGTLDSADVSQISTRFLDQLPPSAAPGFLFACAHHRPPPAAPIVLVQILDGFRHVRELVEANKWLEQQRANLEQQARADQQLIAELRTWLAQKAEAGQWFKEQSEEWQATAQRQAQMIRECQDWIGQLKQANAEVAEQQRRLQAALGEQQSVIDELRGWV